MADNYIMTVFSQFMSPVLLDQGAKLSLLRGEAPGIIEKILNISDFIKFVFIRNILETLDQSI